MRVTITQLRKDLFKLVDHALRGQPLEFTHRGVVFRVVPENQPSKLSRLLGQNVVAPDQDFEKDRRALLKQMASEWEEDWSDL